jgi:hypothetical protein
MSTNTLPNGNVVTRSAASLRINNADTATFSAADNSRGEPSTALNRLTQNNTSFRGATYPLSTDFWGSSNTVSQTGSADRVAVGQSGWYNLPPTFSNHNQVTQDGSNDTVGVYGDGNQLRQTGSGDLTGVTGNNNVVTTEGNKNAVRVTSDQGHVTVQGDNNELELKSKNVHVDVHGSNVKIHTQDALDGHSLSVTGDGYSIVQKGGKLFALDSSGNSAPISQQQDGGWKVGQ